jgi:outer membrane protein assembly factor BamB
MGDIVSPACDGARLYLVSGSELTCVSIETKQTLYTQDLDDMTMASPAIVGDKVYILTDNGKLVVIETADTFKQLAVSEIGEDCYATPAFMDGKMFIRTDKNLYCISSKVE